MENFIFCAVIAIFYYNCLNCYCRERNALTNSIVGVLPNRKCNENVKTFYMFCNTSSETVKKYFIDSSDLQKDVSHQIFTYSRSRDTSLTVLADEKFVLGLT